MRLRKIVVIMGLAVGLSACGGSTVEQACERLDECNALAQGVSVEDCVQETENVLDMLTESQRKDALKVIEDCLDFESCTAYVSCVSGQ